MISIIVAVADNGVIGRDNALPWHITADLRRFKRLTMGHHLIVGRRTFEAIGRPLPGRSMVVLSRDPGFAPQGVEVAASFAAALALCSDDDEVFVGGGEAVYRQALPSADRLYLTRVHAVVEGDARFPELDASRWRLVAREAHPAGEASPYPFTFLLLERVDAANGVAAT